MSKKAARTGKTSSTRHYFDDPDDGPSKTTSHPTFAAICKPAWFYDCGDDFAPFGNAAGNDLLGNLEDWYRGKSRKQAWSFLEDLLESWELPIAHIAETRSSVVKKLLRDSEQERVLQQLDQIAIALAFGQCKITGAVDDDIHAIAIAASDRQALVREHERVAYPKWPHARAKATADKRIRAALDAMRPSSSAQLAIGVLVRIIDPAAKATVPMRRNVSSRRTP